MSRIFIKLFMLLFSLLIALPAFAGEGRTPVFEVGTIINTPGKYIVTRDLVSTAATPGPIITINALDVELDLNGFLLDNSADPLTAAIFVQNTVECVRIHGGKIKGGFKGVEVNEVDKVVIEGLIIYDAVDTGIHLNKANNIFIRNNVVENAPTAGIKADGPPNGVGGSVRKNLISNCGDGIGIAGALKLNISGNTVSAVTGDGVSISGGLGSLTLTANLIDDATEDGIKTAGFYYGGSYSGNIISNCGRHGIYIDGESANNYIYNNKIANNTGDGIHIEGSLNYVDRNLLNSNDVGLVFTGTSYDNTYGRNTARGSASGTDFVDSGTDNYSFEDNLIPGPGLS